MKKLLVLMLLISGSVFATTSSFNGVSFVNDDPVEYKTDIFGNTVAIIGEGRFSGDCYHDDVHYAVIKGISTCPGILAVFPDYEEENHNNGNLAPASVSGPGIFIGIPPSVPQMVVQGSADCQEITNLHDPWR